jgi:hypothetical protein
MLVDVMETVFPYVEIPKALLLIIGEADKGTRCYYAEGSEEQAGAWFDAINDAFENGCVSPGGVSMFAPVTRAGVHKRLKEGRLTVFYFQVTQITESFWGRRRKLRETAYALIPVAECKAWGAELRRRGQELRERDWTPEQKKMYEEWAKKNPLAACLYSTPLPWEKEDVGPGFLEEPDKGEREKAREEYLKEEGAKEWGVWL